MKTVFISVAHYEAKDGSVFKTPEECEHYEKLTAGTRRTCPVCKGRGKVDAYGDGREFHKCSTCSGKGWQEVNQEWS